MTYREAADAKAHYQSVMGEIFGEVYAELWQELAGLEQLYSEYEMLFGHSSDRVEILNRAAPLFFYIVENEFWKACVLRVARLTDHSKMTARNKITRNLTLRLLPELVKSSLKADVEELINSALLKAKFARDWRNRYIAHSDYDLAVKTEQSTPLETASRRLMRAA